MRNLLDTNKTLANLKYIQNMAPGQICMMVQNKNSKLMKHVSGKVDLVSQVAPINTWCDRQMFHKKEITDAWKTLAQMIKSPRPSLLSVMKPANSAAAPAPIPAAAPLPAPAPAHLPVAAPLPAPAPPRLPAVAPVISLPEPTNSLNSIMNAIGALERNVATLKSRVTTWKAAGGKRRKTRRTTRSRF